MMVMFVVKEITPAVATLATQHLVDVLRSAPTAFDHVVLQPIPNPSMPDEGERGFMARIAREVLPRVRRASV